MKQSWSFSVWRVVDLSGSETDLSGNEVAIRMLLGNLLIFLWIMEFVDLSGSEAAISLEYGAEQGTVLSM